MRSLINTLKYLKDHYKILGIKAETESEGSSFDDLYQLKILCTEVGLPLHIKIGGVEAVNDIIQAYKLGADGIIAPMVETDFALHKFLSAVDSIYKNENIELTLNIETKTAFENLNKIFPLAKGRVKNLNVGRTDLSASYFNANITPDSTFVYELIRKFLVRAEKYNFHTSFGGSIRKSTIHTVQKDSYLIQTLSKIETRKVMFRQDSPPDIIDFILQFEKEYLDYKKRISEIGLYNSVQRIEKLKCRV